MISNGKDLGVIITISDEVLSFKSHIKNFFSKVKLKLSYCFSVWAIHYLVLVSFFFNYWITVIFMDPAVQMLYVG